MKPRRIALIAVGVLCASMVSLGRRPLRDARWRDPFAVRGAHPRLREMALWRARPAVRELTGRDPLRATVGAVARDDEGASELHLVLVNRGPCTVRGFRAVVYGYDARGEPTAPDQGAHSVEVVADGLSLAPGAREVFAREVRCHDASSLALAHIDEVTCTDGTRWHR